ncbi:MAG: tetratricopeptide repeat protein [Thermodesulfobacteriota bacterium]
MFGPETVFLVAMAEVERAAVIERTLKSEGYLNVVRVDNGRDALRVIKYNPGCFLLAAWDLLDLSGADLVNEVRHNRACKEMPVILIGSPPNPKTMLNARKAGVDAFVFGVGFTGEALMEKVQRVMAPGRDEVLWPKALVDQAEELLKEGLVDQALAAFEETIVQARKRSAALNAEIGLLLMEKGEMGEAVTALEQAVEDDPDLPRAQAALGAAYLRTGRPVEAARVLEQAWRLDPRNQETQARLGESLLESENYGKAEEVFQVLLESDPGNMFYLNRLAIALRKQGKYTLAVNLYRQALEVNDRDENLHFNLGRCCFEARWMDLAVASLVRALEINPDFESARLLLDKIRGGD